MKKGIILSGHHYEGRIGKYELTKNKKNVMFYPQEGEFPYRVVVPKKFVKEINEKERI